MKLSSLSARVNIDCQRMEYHDDGITSYFDAKFQIEGLILSYPLIQFDANQGRFFMYQNETDTEPSDTYQVFTHYDHSMDYCS